MRKKRFSVEQMIGVLKQAEVGVPVAEVIRKAGISEQTFYRWKAKYAGLEVDQVRQMAQLQEENMRLKRLCKEEGLMLKRMKSAGKRKAARLREEKVKPTAPDEAWSMDFVSDQLQDGTRFRSLTIVDVYTREAVAIEVGQSLKGDDVVRTLNRLKLERGIPKVLFCDNGSEFTSHAMDLWAYRNGVKIDFSRPGKPTDNAFVESFNGTFRSECLNTHWFLDLKEARQLIEAWRREYNESRPHASLGDRTPSEFASESAASRALTAT